MTSLFFLLFFNLHVIYHLYLACHSQLSLARANERHIKQCNKNSHKDRQATTACSLTYQHLLSLQTVIDQCDEFVSPKGPKLVAVQPYLLLSPSSKSDTSTFSRDFRVSLKSNLQDEKSLNVRHSRVMGFACARTVSCGPVNIFKENTFTSAFRFSVVHSTSCKLGNPLNMRTVIPASTDKGS